MVVRRVPFYFVRLAAACALLASCVLCALPSLAFAEVVSQGACGENLSYTLEGEENNLHLEVVGEGDMTSYTWLQRGSEITSVTLPDGLTSLCDSAFYRCTALHSITIPEGVTRIGSNCFFGCYSLTTVDLPSTVNEIGRWAFANTGVSYLRFKGPEGLKDAPRLYIEGFGYNAICLRELSFGEGITEIPLNALSPGSVNLAAVSIPRSANVIQSDTLDTLTTIGEIYYAGGAAQWLNITKTRITYNPLNKASVVYYATDGERHSNNTTFAVAAGGGTISPVGCVDASSSTTFSVWANEGYELDYVRIDGIIRPDWSTYVVGGDGQDHSVYAKFKKASAAQTSDTPESPATPNTPSGPTTPSGEYDPNLPDPNHSDHSGNPGKTDPNDTEEPSSGETDPRDTHSGNPSAPPVKNDDVRVPDDGPPEPGWKQIDGSWWYYDAETLQPVTGWQVIDSATYFFTPEGRMVVGWQYIEGEWYYFGTDGAMQRGWVFDGSWYFLSNAGVMQRGWLYRDGAWYYLLPGGAMATGWLWDGAWYYFDPSGPMHRGWLCRAGAWYYLFYDGKMATGWVLDDNGLWYYFKANGIMLADAWLWQDAWYYFCDAGYWIT